MQNKFIITITDVKGSKQYNIHQFVKHILLYIALLILAIILVAFTSIKLLISEVASIEKNRNKLVEDYQRIEQINKNLDAEVAQKNNDMEIIRGRLGSLEGFIGITQNDNENITMDDSGGNISYILERVDLAKVTAEQKGLTMRMVPSGSPVEYVQISSPFGYRMHPLLKRQEYHSGIDLRVPVGTKIYATADGVVSFSKMGYNGGYGVMVKIDHAYGFRTVYAHLSKPNVNEGDFVKKGQVIAYSGNSGLSTGPHLHYEILFLQERINPKPFLDWTMKDYNEIFEKEKSIKWQSLLNVVSAIREIVPNVKKENP